MKILCKIGGMLTGLFLLCAVNLYAQKNNFPETKSAIRGGEMQQILIDKFVVTINAQKEFVERMRLNGNFIKKLPGLAAYTEYEEIEAKGEISYVTIAVWMNAEALSDAKKAVQAEFQKQNFVPSEMLKRLNIKLDRAVYKEIEK